MKQFITCLYISALFHFLSSLLGGNFNPMKWAFETELQRLGFTFYVFFMFCIWLVPIAFNYLDGRKNFKDE